jgi:hypothetical protein
MNVATRARLNAWVCGRLSDGIASTETSHHGVGSEFKTEKLVMENNFRVIANKFEVNAHEFACRTITTF